MIGRVDGSSLPISSNMAQRIHGTMENSRKRKGALVSYVGFIIVAVVFGFLLWKRPSGWVTYGIGLIPALLISSLIHELCHLGAYVVLRIPWKCLRFACFLLEKRQTGIHLSIDRSRWIGEAACTCLYKREISHRKYAVALLSGGGGCVLLAVVIFLLPWGGSLRLRCGLWCISTALLSNGLFHLLWPGCEDRKLLRAVSENRKEKNL